MTTSGASAVTTTGSHCQLTDSWCWICGIFILYILSFYSSEMDNVSSANGKQQMALKAVVGFWTALARVESNRALITTGWRRESSTAAGIAKKRRSLSPTISTGSEDVWNLACFGNDSQKVRPVTIPVLFCSSLSKQFPGALHQKGLEVNPVHLLHLISDMFWFQEGFRSRFGDDSLFYLLLFSLYLHRVIVLFFISKCAEDVWHHF